MEVEDQTILILFFNAPELWHKQYNNWLNVIMLNSRENAERIAQFGDSLCSAVLSPDVKHEDGRDEEEWHDEHRNRSPVQ